MGPARHWAIQLRLMLLLRFSKVGLAVSWTFLELTISLSCMDDGNKSRTLKTLMSFNTFQIVSSIYYILLLSCLHL